MKYRQLGQSGLTVSVVGLGCNNFGGNAINAPSGTVYGLMDLEQTRAVVDAAFDAGVTLFDTADVYGQGGSESFLGEILSERRHQVVLATKWGSGMEQRHDIAWGSRRYIRQACEASLRRLKTDYIDLYQMHWPDPRTPIEETLAALDELVKEGKVRYLGSSHFSGWQIADTNWIAQTQKRERFISAQNHYSLIERSAEAELLPACEKFGVGLLPYFPLANGLLTGKYRRNRPVPADTRLAGRVIDDRIYDLIENLLAYAAARGRTLVDVAVGALLVRKAVASVITGATKVAQITSNAAAATWEPSAEDMVELDAILKQASEPTRTAAH
jgi:aryl-alcohol dehydrogenase-like predicted oxidoreductase